MERAVNPSRNRSFNERDRRAAKDRLQPALLDRLIDHAPDKKKESADSLMITYEALRTAVLRDLTWLLNSVNMETVQDLEGLTEVKQSCVNYGISALAGVRMSEIDLTSLENSLKQSILTFEPRILSEALEVSCQTEKTTLEHHNILSLLIKGRLWCNPHPREFSFKTDIDLESGHMDVVEYNGAN